MSRVRAPLPAPYSGHFQMKIGVPTELKDQEFRVGLTPASVDALVAAGHDVALQRGCGVGSGISDEEFVAAGGHILEDADSVFDWGRNGDQGEGAGGDGVLPPARPDRSSSPTSTWRLCPSSRRLCSTAGLPESLMKPSPMHAGTCRC